MFLTAAETRERLRISRDTLTKLIRSGELKAQKIGDFRNSPYRIDEDDLREYLDRQAIKTASA